MIATPWARVVRVLLVTMSVAFAPAWTRAARADEIWVPPSSQQDLGGLEIASNAFWPVTPIGAVRLAWAVPNNLQTFQSAKVVLIPGSPGGAASVNVLICPAQNGNAAAGGCVGPFAQSFTGVANQLVEVEIGPSIASHIGAAGLTYLAVIAYTTPTTTTDHIVGLRFSYTPTAPGGTATLGANTFSGTQTAPAFVGSGAGLTNLPVPPGVATLTANTFTGTQTAPAFVGSGAGLTNLPLPAGAATLGANTFSGTQTAPAFVGSGAGLTNLPLPAGAATLGANTFSGTQTAPAFVGSGAGLTNLPFPAGAVTLGANTFSSTQTIDTGNLDLDPSTATAGNLTKNGSLFLHNFGTQNIFAGVAAGNVTMTGASNVGVGFQALANNTTGGTNVALGAFAGSNASTGSDNIYLGANATGVAGESGAIYLGVPGTQTKTVVAGVRGTTVAGPEMVVVDAGGRLGSAPVPSGGSGDLGPDSVTSTMVAFNYAGSTSKGGPATNLVCVACVDASEVSFSFVGTGANTFTATQTVDNGNLDLDASTATAGNLTKNGTRFLHNFGTNNTFLGLSAGNLSMTGAGKNVAVGATALMGNTTGDSNTAAGYQALLNNSSGSGNTAAGASALLSNTLGTGNTASGALSLTFNSLGTNNTANGYFALGGNASGNQNTASGSGALLSNSSGSNNTAIGYGALQSATGGSNVALGASAGLNSTSGSNNIYIGAGINGVAGESNTMYLGKFGQQTKAFIAGVRGTTTVNPDAIPVMVDSAGQLGTISSSVRFKEDIHDMADASRRLLRLRPVTFRYTQAYINGAKPIQYGLIAEEVAEIFPELAVRDADGRVETVHYETLNVLLLNELQKQVRHIEEQDRLNEEQQRRIEALERRLNSLLDGH